MRLNFPWKVGLFNKMEEKSLFLLNFVFSLTLIPILIWPKFKEIPSLAKGESLNSGEKKAEIMGFCKLAKYE